MFKKICLIILLLSVLISSAFACSALYFENGKCRFIGTNLEGEGVGDGLIFVNARNLTKTTDMYNKGEEMKWISKYGSITFNLVCREYAQYGMNESGLIITTVSDPRTQGPDYDGRPEMPGHFWLQYALDVCKDLDEVKETISRVRVIPGSDRYFVTESSGKSMVIEFIDGEVVFYEEDYLPVKILTNMRYMDALEHYVKGTLPSSEAAFDSVSTLRFVKGAKRLNRRLMIPSARLPYLFETLRRIEGNPGSIWRIIFHQTKNKIYFITRYNMRLRFIDLDKIDFTYRSNKMMIEVNAELEGELNDKFIVYDQASDIKLYKSAMEELGISVSLNEIEEHVQFLNTFYVW